MKYKTLIGAALTHPGQVREINQDSVVLSIRSSRNTSPAAFLAVADGIGGHKAGEVASELATDALSQILGKYTSDDDNTDTVPLESAKKQKLHSDPTNHLEWNLQQAIEAANQNIFQYSKDNPEDAGNLGSTVTCLLIQDGMISMAHVGDSRGYLLRKGFLIQITEDHSFVGQLIRGGQLPQEAYYEHPRRNIITRALGQTPEVVVDLLTDTIEPGDKYMVCTDGLWEMVRDENIRLIMDQKDSPEAIVQKLVEAANENGGSDNIGVVMIEVVK